MRSDPRPFTESDLSQLSNFAAQAVIAIENTRLLNELRESLEQQTATSDVLRVISSSPGELQPVFETLLANAVRLCEAKFGSLLLYEGDWRFRVVAMSNVPPAFAELRQREPTLEVTPQMGLGRAVATRDIVHIADYAQEAIYKERRHPGVRALGDLGGARTVLVVPMLKDEKIVGAICIYRQQVRPFADKQIELVKNFASQAVIAVENARLLNELRQRTTDLTESLEQQTATADVLRVISSSPGELKPVFQAMLENATRICEAKFGMLFRLEDGAMLPVASLGVPEPLMEFFKHGPHRPSEHAPIMRVARTKQPVHVLDFATERAYLEGSPVAVAGVELGGVRTILVVPLLKENELIGAFAIFQRSVPSLTNKLNLQEISLPKPLSPSRTRGC
jgi:GAF domain-containing protein